MIYHLKIGSLGEAISDAKDSESSIERDALLVYTGVFQSADGEVKVDDDHLERLSANHNGLLSKVKRFATAGTSEIPLKHYPPIQLDHSTSAKDTIGRLVGNVDVRETEINGEKVKALFGRVRILGRENVERVLDGRWTNLSIGADFDEGYISEVTVTPFPAASDASLLSRKKMEKKEMAVVKKGSHKGIDYQIHEESDGETTLYVAKYSIKGKQYISDDFGDPKNTEDKVKKDIEKKLGGLSDDNDDDDKLSDDSDADDELTDDSDADDKGKEAKLTAAREKIKKLSIGFKQSLGATRLAAKQSTILNRLSKLRADGKITPAEIKKMDISKLSASSDEAISLVMQSYEDREPVIMAGMIGDSRSIDVSKITKQRKLSKLEAETRANMPFMSHVDKNVKRFAEGEKEETGSPDTVNIHVDTDPHTDLESEYGEIEKLMDDWKNR